MAPVTRRRRLRAGVLVAATFALTGAGLAAAPGQAAQPDRWNAAQVHLSAPAQAAGQQGAGIVVAVLDTWIDTTHPDFGGRVLTGADCVGGTCRSGNPGADGCEAHGTHVAGIVASADYGVAPSARILPVRVLAYRNGVCVADSQDVANGIRWAAAHGAQVENISLGTAAAGENVSNVAAAVQQVTAQGVLVVAAAGNQRAPVGTSYSSDAVVVAATGPTGSLASYSQSGNGVVLAAPGGDAGAGACTVDNCVVSTWANNEYAALAGTSMAAPHVAGLAALLLAQQRRSPAALRQRMTGTAHPLAGGGAGLIDVAGALGVAASPSRPAAAPPRTVVAVPAAAGRVVLTSRPAPARATPAPRPAARAPRPTRRRPPAPPRPVAAAPTAHHAAAVAAGAVPRPSDRDLPVSLAALATGLATAVLLAHGRLRRRRA